MVKVRKRWLRDVGERLLVDIVRERKARSDCEGLGDSRMELRRSWNITTHF